MVFSRPLCSSCVIVFIFKMKIMNIFIFSFFSIAKVLTIFKMPKTMIHFTVSKNMSSNMFSIFLLIIFYLFSEQVSVIISHQTGPVSSLILN